MATYAEMSATDGSSMKIARAEIAAFLRDCIPPADGHDEAEWQLRHRVVVVGYAISAVIVAIVGFVNGFGGDSALHGSLELAILALPGAGLLVINHRFASELLASLGLLVVSGMLVHFTGGLIESHFAFFVLLPLIALYTDWRTYVFSVVYVAVTHGIVGAIDPASVYNHEAAIAAPFTWGVVHAGYVLALSTVMLVHWNFSDRRRIELDGALRDLHEAQRQLVEAQKLESIGALAAGVAHEINTPIQFVGDNLEFIADAADGVGKFVNAWLDARPAFATHESLAPTVADLDAIVADADLEFNVAEIPDAVSQSIEGVHRVAEIVRAMKGFSHPNDEITPSDLNRLISDTIAVARNEWKYVAEVDLDLAEDLPLTPVPPGSFNQVVLNIVVNAAHAIADRPDGGDPGRIRVVTRRRNDAVTVSIGDNGCGIPEEIRDRIFEQFFTTKEVGRGTGQGLSIARSLMDGLGGRIEIESEPGVGTTFTLEFPLVHEKEPVDA